MDEFADLEDELRFDEISADTESIKSLVKSIECDGLDPTIFITEQRNHWNVYNRIWRLALGIVLLPVLGIGLLFIYAVFTSGPFFQNTEVVEAKVYVAEQDIVIDYRMVDIQIKKLNCLQVTHRSYIKHNSREISGSEGGSSTLHQYHLVTDQHELWLMTYRTPANKDEIQNKRNVHRFAEIAELKISF